MKILVADDDPVSNRILMHTLSRWGHEVTAVPDGELAWYMLSEPDAPRFAILDRLLPGVGGVELCQKIRAQVNLPYTYVILLTGKSEKSALVEGLKAGADDYVTKPYDPRELEVRIGVRQRIVSL